MSDLYHISYISRVNLGAMRRGFDDHLNSVIALSQTRHMEQDVSGCMICTGTHFLELLEGHNSDVIAAYQDICDDPLHHKPMVLSLGTIDERRFPDRWLHFTPVAESSVTHMPEIAALVKQIGTGIEPNDVDTLFTSLASKFSCDPLLEDCK